MDEILALWDYRRRVAELYLRARAMAKGSEGGAAAAWVAWRTGRDELFATHPSSPVPAPARPGWPGLDYFGYHPSWRLEADVEPLPESAGLAAPHSGAGSTPLRPFARLTAHGPRGPLALLLYWLEAYGGGVFLPFADATNGGETYGGGRYLLDSVKGADLGHAGRTVVLDFNFAYHPSCVHDARWSCPLAPPENRLGFPIPAGERLAG